MNKIMKLLFKYATLMMIGGCSYMLIECCWRFRTHWSMGILGGLCFVEIGLINELYSWKTPLIIQSIMSALLVTANEFIAGLIVNIALGWNVWDYSNIPLNLMGQICLPFTILWIFVSCVAIMLDDYLRFRLFGEKYPVYVLWKGKHWVPFKYRRPKE